MQKPTILIIGYGMVGKHLYKEFPWADIHDPLYQLQDKDKNWDLAFISVPTESLSDGSCDTSIVDKVVQEFKDRVKIFIIKSTIPPGTTDNLIKKYNCDIVFSPEYYGITPHSNDIPPMNFITLGGDKYLTNQVAQLYMLIHSAYFRINQTDAKTAELVKYMENCWLANQVSFANEFYRIAKIFDIDYIELRELFICDSRVSPANTYVYEQAPYWDSHCFNKDIPAIIEASKKAGYLPEILNNMLEVNNKFKKDKI